MFTLLVAAAVGAPDPFPVARPPMPIARPACVCSGGVCDLCPDCRCQPAPAPAAPPAPRSFVDAATGCTYTETAPGSGRYVRTSCPVRR